METTLSHAPIPWQLQMFQRSLKKQSKLKALLAEFGEVSNQACLLVTCGDNNGALNWHFRAYGGYWTWGDVKGENIVEISDLLGDPVYHLVENRFPFSDERFDCVVTIDVLEHLDDDKPFLCELYRVLRPGGRLIATVPNGDPRLLVNRIKFGVGMKPEVYGHTRAGYTPSELRRAVEQVRFVPLSESSYSGFFTEMIELVINFGYVFVLKRKSKNKSPGQIAPASAKELEKHGTAYWIYTLLYPVMNLISKFDRLFPANTYGAVILTASKTSVDEHG